MIESISWPQSALNFFRNRILICILLRISISDKTIGKITIYILCSITIFPKILSFVRYWGKSGIDRQITEGKLMWRTSVLCCITDYRHTLMISNVCCITDYRHTLMISNVCCITDYRHTLMISNLCCITDYRHTLMLSNTYFFPWQEYLYESASMIRHAYLTSLVL